jgi:hypothetical protein
MDLRILKGSWHATIGTKTLVPSECPEKLAAVRGRFQTFSAVPKLSHGMSTKLVGTSWLKTVKVDRCTFFNGKYVYNIYIYT